MWGGPDQDLQDRLNRAAQVDRRVMPAESDDASIARHQRMWSAETYDDLAEGDRKWLDAAVAAVNAGHAPRMEPDLVGGDWAAEDAAEDAGDPVPVSVPDVLGGTGDEVDDASTSGDWVGV